MNVTFRVDASLQIGSGHVMRCLTLAESLRKRCANVSFISRELPGNLISLVKSKGFMVYNLPYKGEESNSADPNLPHSEWLGVNWKTDSAETKALLVKEKQDIDWLVIDHYALDLEWEKEIRLYVKKIMVIDDLADRYHDCDLLLDQNLYDDMGTRYQGLIPEDCQTMLGPQFALLRPEFAEARKNLKDRDGTVCRILIFLGGSDLTDETSKVLAAINLLNRRDIVADVVIGVNNLNRYKIESTISGMPQVSCHYNVSNMAEFMVSADLFIGAAGITTWERCCLGLPSLVMTVADNQVQVMKDMAKYGLLYLIGENNKVDKYAIKDCLQYFLENPSILKKYTDKSMKLVDGLGADKCADIILNKYKKD